MRCQTVLRTYLFGGYSDAGLGRASRGEQTDKTQKERWLASFYLGEKQKTVKNLQPQSEEVVPLEEKGRQNILSKKLLTGT